MELILLEKVAQLGDPGDLVNVKSGYGRNFLIPTGKAVRADEENKAEYEKRKEALMTAEACLLYTSPSPRDQRGSRMPSSA